MTAAPLRLVHEPGPGAPPPRPAVLHAAAAVGRAMDDGAEQDALAADAVRIPWPSVAQLTGPLAPGRLTLLSAGTGAGKTTVALNLALRIAFAAGAAGDVRRGSWIYCGTEMRGWELWRTAAALLEGVPPGVATGGDWAALTPRHVQRIRDLRAYLGCPFVDLRTAADVRAVVEAAEAELMPALGRHVQFHDAEYPTVADVHAVCTAAAERGARLVILDHVGRLDLGPDYPTRKAGWQAIRELAAAFRVHIIATVQQNRDVRRGGPLVPYRTPQLVGLEGGDFFAQEATCVLGVWRPIRACRQDEDPKAYLAAKRAVEDGTAPVSTMLEKNTLGVALLKHRYPPIDATVGDECRLRVFHGQITDRAT